jgi:glycosyltransferase involved in cell wall biosynthesis
LLALNDRHVAEPVEAVEETGGLRVPILRLPAGMDWAGRLERAAAFRASQSVDWISLQFVAYAFDGKGIVRNLARHLGPIVKGSPVHIMFHELWIGTGHAPPFKDRVVGRIQRRYIRKLAQLLRPAAVTTTNSFYRSLLKELPLPAIELPLFGNISISTGGPGAGLREALVRADLCDQTGSHPNHRLGLFFGALYPEWKSEPFLSQLISAAKKVGKRAGLISAGRLGKSGEEVWKKLRAGYGNTVDFVALGEQPTAEISALMQIADFGLATSPWHLLGKSGSVAAMLEHGLPVIVTRDEFRPDTDSVLFADPLLHRCDSALESKLETGLPKRPAQDHVEKTARDFISILTQANPGAKNV